MQFLECPVLEKGNANLESFQRVVFVFVEIDVKKMPLGKLSKLQIAKGFEVLEEIEAALTQKKSRRPCLEELSSKFFTTIPHNFGRTTPPTINNNDIVEKKKEMLMVIFSFFLPFFFFSF